MIFSWLASIPIGICVQSAGHLVGCSSRCEKSAPFQASAVMSRGELPVIISHLNCILSFLQVRRPPRMSYKLWILCVRSQNHFMMKRWTECTLQECMSESTCAAHKYRWGLHALNSRGLTFLGWLAEGRLLPGIGG